MTAPDGNRLINNAGRNGGSAGLVIERPVDSEDRDHKMVPVKPTARQLAAGARAGGVTVESAWRIYQAMVVDA